MSIDVRDMHFYYDKSTPLLHDVTLSIKARSCVALFGPNGGGKTTFLKLLMGLLQPSLGLITVGGHPPTQGGFSMGYVPQTTTLDRDFPMTALEVVKMGALSSHPLHAYLPNAQEEAEQSLERVGLSHVAQRRFGSLSGGQAQRVLIARALMRQPDYLFLDEVTSHVDADAEKEFHHSMRMLKGTTTIVMVTHHLPSVIEYVDQLLCVYGMITPYSPPEVCEHFAYGLYHSKFQAPPC